MSEDTSQVVRQRREKAEALKEEGVNLYPNSFRPGIRVADLAAVFGGLSDDELKERTDKVTLAGRIMARRDYGKSVFMDLKDGSGRIQIYVRKNDVGAEVFGLQKKLDIGDIIGVSGRLFRTKTGELTVLVEALELVTKSMVPLPEKYHEINVEMKYRQRYVDLIMNDRTREIFFKRAQVVTFLRDFLIQRGFIEVETPMMQPIPGGATAKPFETHHLALDMKLYLRIAPELYLKRLLVGGFERVFELNRNFRNEGISTQHNPEFTMLEFYQSYATYQELMDLTEEMFAHVARGVTGGHILMYQGRTIDLSPPWRRIPFYDSLREIGQVPETVIADRAQALAFCKDLGAQMPPHEKHGKILAKIFDLTVEPKLEDPTFITHYPTEISPLARKNAQDGGLTDRFELFISGREMANGFSELNDPQDQKERFLAQVAEREAGDEEAQFMDEDYIRALMFGMPPAAGEGVGVDRLVMLMVDAASIKDVILFPHHRPERKADPDRPEE